jgi:hypothetical protein
MLLAIATWLLLGQDQVTIQLKAQSARTAVAELSKQTGVPLFVQPRLQPEVVTVDVKKMPLRALLDHLAYVLHAEVENEGAGFKIARSLILQKNLETAEIESRTQAIQAVLDRKKKELDKYPTPSSRADQMIAALARQIEEEKEARAAGKTPRIIISDVWQFSPAGRLLQELIQMLGSKRLASVLPHRTQLCTNQPITGQVSLPGSLKDHILDYFDNEQRIGDYLAANQMSESAAMHYSYIFEAAKMPAGIGKIRLNIRRGGNVLAVGLMVFTKTGDLRSWANDRLGDVEPSPRSSNRRAKTVAISELAAEYVGFVRNIRKGFEPGIEPLPKAITPALRQAFARPEESDPLEYLAGEPIRALAADRKQDIIACISDAMASVGEVCIDGAKVDINRFEELLGTIGDEEISDAKAVIRIRPRSPIEQEEARLSRAALGPYLRSLLATKMETLREISRLHFQAGVAASGNPLSRLSRYGLQNLRIRSSIGLNEHSHEYYCLYGAFEDRAFKSSAKIRTGEMSGAQRRALQDWLFRDLLEGDEAERLSDLMKFPDEAFSGELPNGLLTFSASEIELAKPARDGIVNWAEPFSSPVDMATGFADVTRRNKWWTLSDSSLDQSYYLLGSMHRDELMFQVTPKLYKSDAYDSRVAVAPGVKPVPYSQLPESFRLEVKRLYDDIMKH